jgi:tetratricopeptide (TPR) repeat protein
MVSAYLELGAVHQDRRQHTQALDAYRRAIDVAPDNPQPYYEAGLLLKEGRDYQGAEDMLRRAAHLARNDVNIHRQLGALVAINLVHSRKTLPIDS